MSFISKLFAGFLALFQSAATKAWNALGLKLQNNSLTAVGAVQILKENLSLDYVSVRNLIIQQFGLTTLQVDTIIHLINKQFNIVPADTATLPEEVWDYLRTHATSLDNDAAWSGFFQGAMKAVSIWLSGGKLDWVTLSYGLAQIAYDRYVDSKK